MSDEYADHEMAMAAAERLRSLPELERITIALHIMEGVTVPEVAQLLRHSEAQVRRLLRDGLRRLRLALAT